MLADMDDRRDITVVLADDHAVVRKGLRLLLEAEPGMHVLAEAGTVPDAVRMAKAHRPNVLVLDLNMPGGSSLEAIPTIIEQTESTAIVVLTMQNDPSFARQALQAGALGFVLKEAADDELLGAIRLAAEGETYLNPRLGARLAAQPDVPVGPPDDLSDRELEVLKLIALGHTNAEIGTSCSSACGRSSRTARTSSRRPAGPHAPSSSATRSSTGWSSWSTPDGVTRP